MIRAALVEDSRLARVELKELLKAHPQIELVAEAETPTEAKTETERLKPDLLFLDINLRGGNGFELLDSLEYVPQVIFTTAYDEYAIKAFEHNALDYLLKPISPDALARAIKRLTVPEQQTEPSLPVSQQIFVKDNDRCWLVALTDIRYFESCGNYARLHFENNKPMIYKSLRRIEQRLPVDLFFRVSRQFIVNLNAIADLSLWDQGFLLTMNDGKEITVSRRHSQALKERLSL